MKNASEFKRNFNSKRSFTHEAKKEKFSVRALHVRNVLYRLNIKTPSSFADLLDMKLCWSDCNYETCMEASDKAAACSLT